MWFLYLSSLCILSSIICSNIVTNTYILDNLQHNPKGDSLLLLNEIYSRNSLVSDTTSFNNTRNYISLKNRNNNFNIHSLNDRIYFYKSGFIFDNIQCY